MSPKIGRPTDSPKTNRTAVRMDSETADVLNAYCKQEKVSRAEAIRRAIMRLKPDIKK